MARHKSQKPKDRKNVSNRVFGRYPPPGFVITTSSIAPSFILTKPPAVEPFSQLS